MTGKKQQNQQHERQDELRALDVRDEQAEAAGRRHLLGSRGRRGPEAERPGAARLEMIRALTTLTAVAALAVSAAPVASAVSIGAGKDRGWFKATSPAAPGAGVINNLAVKYTALISRSGGEVFTDGLNTSLAQKKAKAPSDSARTVSAKQRLNGLDEFDN